MVEPEKACLAKLGWYLKLMGYPGTPNPMALKPTVAFSITMAISGHIYDIIGDLIFKSIIWL